MDKINREARLRNGPGIHKSIAVFTASGLIFVLYPVNSRKKIAMNKIVAKRTLCFLLLLFPLLGSNGCPLAMDYADAKLQAVNHSDAKIVFAVKDSVEGIISWAVVEARSQKGIGLVNFKWEYVLPNPTAFIRVYCIEYSKWDQSKGWDQITGQNSLKHSVYTRAQLDTTAWEVIYP